MCLTRRGKGGVSTGVPRILEGAGLSKDVNFLGSLPPLGFTSYLCDCGCGGGEQVGRIQAMPL